jgi:hypothetical protein
MYVSQDVYEDKGEWKGLEIGDTNRFLKKEPYGKQDINSK